MRVYKKVDVSLSVEEIIGNISMYSHFEVELVFLGLLEKLRKYYSSQLNLHQKYLKRFLKEDNKRLIKYQRDCVKALDKAVRAIVKMEYEVQKMLGGIEDYCKARGGKGPYPWNEKK